MRKYRLWICLCLILSLLAPTAYAASLEEIGFPAQTRAYVLATYPDGEILESYHGDDIMEIASLTKLLAYFVAMDAVTSGQVALNDKVTMTEAETGVEGSTFDTQPGQMYMLSELLEAMLVVSANDATLAVARHIAGNEEAFVELMRQKATDLGIYDAQLYNSTGLPTGEGHLQNSMTPTGLVTLTKALLDTYPEVLSITQKPRLQQPDRDYDEPNTNQLLGVVKGVDGLKTGFTDAAGNCQITTGTKEATDDTTEPLRFIAVVMGAETREARTDLSATLMNYAYENYERRVVGGANEILGNATFSRGTPYEAPYYAGEARSFTLKIGEAIESDVQFQENRRLPITAGEPIGEITFYRGDTPLYTTDVILKEDINTAGKLSLIQRLFTDQLQMFASYFQ